MKIKSVHIQRFRQFEDNVINVGDFNVLIGPNNSGKTSILHAIRAFYQLMNGHIRHEGDPPSASYHRRFISDAEEIAPTPDIKELWFNKAGGKQLKISITYEDGISFGVILRQQFGQIHVSAEKLPEGLSSDEINNYLGSPVAFIPGLVGVLVNEPYVTIARRNSLANQGRYSEIFRSSLEQLNSKDENLVTKINYWLEDLFDVEVSNVKFDSSTDEYVTVKYSEKKSDFDVVSSGAGMQQVIQILTYIYLTQPKILLIDEPDAHLHSRLQARLGEVFRRVATDLDAQVFISTHSLDLIDTFSTDEIIVINSEKKELSPLGGDEDLISSMVDANIVDISSLSRLLSSRKLVIIEDKDKSIYQAIDKCSGIGLFLASSDSYVLSAEGVDNFGSIVQLGKLLKELTNDNFDLLFIRDRDGLPDFLVDLYSDSQNTNDVKLEILGRHEIENYLIEPGLIRKALLGVGIDISEEELVHLILSTSEENKHVAQSMTLEISKKINRYLESDQRLSDGKLQEETLKWFNGLDLNSLPVIQKVFPGKELLHEILKAINEKYSTRITKGKLIFELEDDLIADDIKSLLRLAAGDIKE